MRSPWITSREALRQRLTRPDQVAPTAADAEMPPYMESFLASIRLLIGVPFEYLVADPRLLPDESIRFFYVDRSWADRLVDGAIAVGKIGTREQAHHQAHEPAVRQQLDQSERIVRGLQRRGSFADLKLNLSLQQQPRPADVMTGFLLRSAAVSGWPQMDVRAYDQVIPEPFDPAQWAAHQLTTQRLERLSPSVLLALFEGVPRFVILEEPHHNVQFGIHYEPGQSAPMIDYRSGTGDALPTRATATPQHVPMRRTNSRVVAIAALRKQIDKARAGAFPSIPPQTGSAAFATEVLSPPWRQRFEGTTDEGAGGGDGRFRAGTGLASLAAAAETESRYRQLLIEMPPHG